MSKVKNFAVKIGEWLSKMLLLDQPAKALMLFTVVTGFFWVLQATLFQRILPLDAVEAIVWGRQMQWGQMKSPPLSGYLAYAAFWLSGNHDWSLYLIDQLTVCCGIFFVYKLGREFFDESGAAIGAMLIYFLIYYMPPALKFCSHSTQYAFMPAMTYFFYRAYCRNHWGDWIGLAIFSALAMLGKYSAGQLLLAFAIMMICTAQGRKLFASIKPYVAVIVFLLLLAPHIVWLFQNDFLPLLHLENRTGSKIEWYEPLLKLAIFVYPYATLAALLILASFPWKKAPRKSVDHAALKFILPVALIPSGIYLLLAFSGHSTVDQWFSYMCSYAGIVAVSLMPFKCDKQTFRRITGAAWLYFLLLLVITVIDVNNKPRFKIHIYPQDIINVFDDFCAAERGAKVQVPVVYGDRYAAGVLDVYHPEHPRCFDAGDLCCRKLYLDEAAKGGMILVDIDEKSAREFLGIPPEVKITFKTYKIQYRSQFGRKKNSSISFAYLPPGSVGKF